MPTYLHILQHQYSEHYHVWNDAAAYWSPPSFATLDDAIAYAEKWQHPTHAKRIYHRDVQLVTVLPLSVVNRHLAHHLHPASDRGTYAPSIIIS